MRVVRWLAIVAIAALLAAAMIEPKAAIGILAPALSATSDWIVAVAHALYDTAAAACWELLASDRSYVRHLTITVLIAGLAVLKVVLWLRSKSSAIRRFARRNHLRARP